MNDIVIFQIDKCMQHAVFYKERMMHQEFQYFKGQLVGIGNICFICGLFDEANLCKKLSKGYPFEGKKPIDFSKIVDVKTERNT